MAATITVSCPKCKKTIKAPESLKGKKIKCKGCGTAFPVVEAKPKDEEWGVVKAYGMTAEDDTPRCPFCTQELEDENAVICLHCGYNLQTRERIQARVLQRTGASDYIVHLLPGIACAVAFLCILGTLIWIWIIFWPKVNFDEPASTLSVPVYLSVACLGAMAFFGGFAVKRLIMNPRPPEKEKVEKEEAPED